MTSVGGCKTAAMLSEGVWVMSVCDECGCVGGCVNSLSTAFNPIWDL